MFFKVVICTGRRLMRQWAQQCMRPCSNLKCTCTVFNMSLDKVISDILIPVESESSMNWIVHGHLCLESESEPFGTFKSTIYKPWRLNGSTCRKGLISCKLWPIQTNILSLWSIIHHQTGVGYRKSANIQYTLYVIHTCDLFRYFCFKFKKTYWRQ